MDTDKIEIESQEMGEIEDVDNTNTLEETDETCNEKDEKKSIWRYILLIILLILLLFSLKGCYDKVSKKDNSVNRYGITLGDIESHSRTQDEINRAAKEGQFTTFLNKNLFIDSDNVSNILVKNDSSNSYNAYVEYYIDDKLIFKTDTIKPGYKQEEAIIDYELNEGIYDAKAIFCIVDSAGNNLNTVTVPIKVTKQK